MTQENIEQATKGITVSLSPKTRPAPPFHFSSGLQLLEQIPFSFCYLWGSPGAGGSAGSQDGSLLVPRSPLLSRSRRASTAQLRVLLALISSVVTSWNQREMGDWRTVNLKPPLCSGKFRTWMAKAMWYPSWVLVSLSPRQLVKHTICPDLLFKVFNFMGITSLLVWAPSTNNLHK